MIRKITLALAFAVTATAFSDVKAALFTGETYTASLNFSSAAQTVFQDTMGSVGPFSVDGVEVNNGVSLFNPAATMFVTATETVVSPVNSIVNLTIVARETVGGALTNPLADGSLAQDGTPFQVLFFDLGAFNGGTDGLIPTLTPPFNNFVVNSANLQLIQTDGVVFGQQFSFSPDTMPPAAIAGFGGVNFGADISTFAFAPGVEVAGATLSFDVTVVPEPSCFAIALGGFCFCLHRRRKC